jgi:NADPH:quinone reductase-like Zn-dependent oxidoreductase
MRAVIIEQTEGRQYSPSNPAEPSALRIKDVPIPEIESGSGQVLVQVKASTVTRDELNWPESYSSKDPTLGWEFAGIVHQVADELRTSLRKGQQVYGLSPKGGAWCDFVLVNDTCAASKPLRLDFAEAASVPMNALTAWQALFLHGGLKEPDNNKGLRDKPQESIRVLITGGSGSVSLFLIQLGHLAGAEVTAAVSEVERDKEFLKALGVAETIEYDQIAFQKDLYDVIVDTRGGKPLEDSWKAVRAGGRIISIHTLSYSFVEEHAKKGLTRQGIKALFFIVEPSSTELVKIAKLFDDGYLRTFVRDRYPVEQVSKAVQVANSRHSDGHKYDGDDTKEQEQGKKSKTNTTAEDTPQVQQDVTRGKVVIDFETDRLDK